MNIPETPLPRVEEQNWEPLQILRDASAMLLASSSVQAVVSGILDLAARVIAADAYAVWRSTDSGKYWRVLASRGLSPAYRTEIRAAAASLPSGIWAVSDVTTDPSCDSGRATYLAEGIASLLVVPMVINGEKAGTIAFYWRKPHVISEIDMAYAPPVSNLAAAALTISELHEGNEREKRRLAFLAEASEVLASSLDYETTLQRVAHLAVPHVADWCSVHIVEDGVPTRLVVAHAHPAQLALAEEFSRQYPEAVRGDRGLGAVLRTGVSEIFPDITDEMLVRGARDAEHLQRLRELRITASILVALKARDKVLGAIRLVAAGGRRTFGADDLRLAEDLARRAAVAVDNAQLHRSVINQENRLRTSQAAAKMGSWDWDLGSQKIFWSNEFKRIHGLKPDANAQYDAGLNLIYPDDRDKTLAELRAVLASDADQLTIEHRALTPDGRVLWIHSRGRIGRDSTGKALSISGVSIDVTEHRQAEQALRRTEKLAAAGRLAAIVAHEINNPLEALTNLIYLCQIAPGLPEPVTEHLKTADEELRRIARIVQQTLGFYREWATPALTNIPAIVMEVLEFYRAKARAKNITFGTELDNSASVQAIPGEIRQVVSNLISNAIDATPPHGEIRVSVHGTSSRGRHQGSGPGTRGS